LFTPFFFYIAHPVKIDYSVLKKQLIPDAIV
jgi:hypothetical protein